MRLTFSVPGKPQGKGRPRASRDGHMYTPKQTREYEALIRRCYQLMHKDKKLTGYVSLDIIAVYPIPRGAKKQDRELMIAGKLLPDKKPDGDNIEKAVADALNGVAYDDDKQIVSAHWRKIYSGDSIHMGLVVTVSDEDLAET